MLAYPIELTPDDSDTVMVTFPDLPEAVSFGDDEAHAIARAVDALETMLASYIIDRKDIPVPSKARGKTRTVAPSLLGQLKVAVY